MTKPLKGEQCVLCRSGVSSSGGEHVLPRWLLKEWPDHSGPFTVYVNEEPVRKRDGQVREHASAVRFKLPMCPACNGILNKRFETAAKPLIRRIVPMVSEQTEGEVVLTPSEVKVVARWFVKTWLLLAHPAMESSHQGFKRKPWDPYQPHLYEWMTSGAEMPAGLSAWLMKVDRELPRATETRHVPLPTVVADGETIPFQAASSGLGSLEVSVVYHPGWAIEHPLVSEGRAARLWPPPTSQQVDVGAMPLTRSGEMAWLKGSTVYLHQAASENAQLPPLSETIDLMSLLGSAVKMVTWGSPQHT